MLTQKKFKQLVKEAEKYKEGTLLLAYLYGSQNYNLENEYSDIDIKAVYLLNFNDLIDRKEISKVNGQITRKDLKTWINEIKKSNISILEFLDTNYIYVNPNFKYYIEQLFDLKDDIVHINEKSLYNATLGMINQKIKKHKDNINLLINNPNIDIDFRKLSKEMHRIYFLHNFLYSFFIKNKSFKESLLSEDFHPNWYIKKVKNGEISANKLKYDCLVIETNIRQIKKHIKLNNIDLNTLSKLENLTIEIYTQHLKNLYTY